MRIPVVFIFIVASLCSAQTPSPVVPIACPQSIEITEQPVAPSGWFGQNGKRVVFLQRLALIKRRGDQEGDLAPSSEKKRGARIEQEWEVAQFTGSKLLLRCYYRGSDAAISFEIPAGIGRCTLSYRGDAHGQPVQTFQAACR